MKDTWALLDMIDSVLIYYRVHVISISMSISISMIPVSWTWILWTAGQYFIISPRPIRPEYIESHHKRQWNYCWYFGRSCHIRYTEYIRNLFTYLYIELDSVWDIFNAYFPTYSDRWPYISSSFEIYWKIFGLLSLV